MLVADSIVLMEEMTNCLFNIGVYYTKSTKIASATCTTLTMQLLQSETNFVLNLSFNINKVITAC